MNTPQITEASGIAASRRHPGVLYTHNDSGGKPRIFAISALTAEPLAVFNILGADACDWEDIAVGPGPNGQTFIYIGDIGGNIRSPGYTIYRVREPRVIADGSLDVDSRLKFSWSENNAESLMVDPEGDVYVISKVQPSHVPKLYPLPRFAWGKSVRVPLILGYPVAIRPASEGPVAADISWRGDEILVKTYKNIYYWKKKIGEKYHDTLAREPVSVSYNEEPQGEAVCWDFAGDDYYTLSEGLDQPLWYYKRIIANDTELSLRINRLKSKIIKAILS